MGAHAIEHDLGHFQRSVLLDGSVAGPEEIEAEEEVPVAPFAGGFAALGGEEAAAAGRAGREGLDCVVGDYQEAGEGKKGLVRGEGPG